jgi:hypothetical protein
MKHEQLINILELLGFWTLSIIRYSKNTIEYNVSETRSVSVHRWGEEALNLLGPLQNGNLNHWTTCFSITTAAWTLETGNKTNVSCYLRLTKPGSNSSNTDTTALLISKMSLWLLDDFYIYWLCKPCNDSMECQWMNVQWLRLALSKGPNRVGVSPLTWGRK